MGAQEDYEAKLVRTTVKPLLRLAFEVEHATHEGTLASVAVTVGNAGDRVPWNPNWAYTVFKVCIDMPDEKAGTVEGFWHEEDFMKKPDDATVRVVEAFAKLVLEMEA